MPPGSAACSWWGSCFLVPAEAGYGGTVVVVAFAVLAIVAVLLRGALPVEFMNELSLLFRWHYLVGGAGMFFAEPLIGVGPDGFQDVYPRMRPLMSPESPASAHSAWLDWVASLGVLGLAWVGAVCMMLLRRPVEEPNPDSPPHIVSNFGAVLAGVLVFGVAVFLQLLVEWPVLDQAGAVMRLVGGVVGIGTVMLVLDAFRRGSEATGWLVAMIAAAVLAAQGQIEMVFWLPGSVVVAWALLGLAGSAAIRERSRVSSGWSVGTVLVGLLILLGGVMVTLREAATRRSATELRTLAERMDNGTYTPSPAEVEEARWRAGKALSSQMPEHLDWWDARKVKGATSQLGGLPDRADRERAFELADAWFTARPGATSSGLRSTMARSVHELASAPETLETALRATRTAVEYRPFDPMLRLYLAELLLEKGDNASAMIELDEAERLDEALHLDPLVQFTPAERARLVRARDQAQSSQGSRISPTVRE
ncbi:MAG: hypothetical protein MK085_09080 [Phycisphaerales bacterium]|nr:hypothetical protein [Phycisphaerales bacterium]